MKRMPINQLKVADNIYNKVTLIVTQTVTNNQLGICTGLNLVRKQLNLTVKISSEITVGFKICKGVESEALCQNGFIVFLHLPQLRVV